VLGDLEARVMDVIWASAGELSVRQVRERLGPRHHYKTVMTIMNRLARKGILERRREGRAYLYQPRMPREAFLRSVADSVLHTVIQEFGEVALASFVNVLEEVSPDTIVRLEHLLRERQDSAVGSRKPSKRRDEHGS